MQKIWKRYCEECQSNRDESNVQSSNEAQLPSKQGSAGESGRGTLLPFLGALIAYEHNKKGRELRSPEERRMEDCGTRPGAHTEKRSK